MSLAVNADVPEDVVVLDTDVYSHLYAHHGATAAPKQALKDLLVGRSVVIAVQTRAELLIWPEVRGLPIAPTVFASSSTTPPRSRLTSG